MPGMCAKFLFPTETIWLYFIKLTNINTGYYTIPRLLFLTSSPAGGPQNPLEQLVEADNYVNGRWDSLFILQYHIVAPKFPVFLGILLHRLKCMAVK